MSSKIEIDAIAGPGSIWIETSDIESIDPARDGQHAAAVTVRWRLQYQQSGAFEATKEGKLLRLQLLPRQIKAAVDSLREEQTAFCTDCFDYGKVEEAPKDCVRCQLISACRRSGQGDLRRASPVAVYGPGNGLLFAFVVLFVVWVFTLNRWAGAAVDADRFRADLVGCRTAKHSPIIGKR